MASSAEYAQNHSVHIPITDADVEAWKSAQGSGQKIKEKFMCHSLKEIESTLYIKLNAVHGSEISRFSIGSSIHLQMSKHDENAALFEHLECCDVEFSKRKR